MRHPRILILLLPLLAAPRTSFCAPVTLNQSLEQQKAVLAKLPSWRRETLEWTAKPWKGDDKPFLVTESALARLNKKGSLRLRFAEFEREAMVNPTDALKQFRWASAAWLLKGYKNSRDAQERSLFAPHRALLKAPFPDAPAYARLLFLIEAFKGDGIYGYSLVSPGERILKKHPQSRVIKYYFAHVLSDSSSLPNTERAVKIFTQLQRTQPEDARYPLSIAGAYYSAWFSNKRQAKYGDKAVAAWQGVLNNPRLAPQVTASHKKFIVDTTLYIREQQKVWAKAR